MKIIGIIPARFASTRFPGKPLTDIEGKSMIRRVYEQAKLATSLSELIVATDDERIKMEVERFGGKVMMTSPDHRNGTERCAEIAAESEADVVINIQGDEPFIHPEQIDLVAGLFTDADTDGMPQIGTLIKTQPLNEELQNPSRVKVVLNKQMEGIYFSRSVIPFIRNHPHFTVQGFHSKLNFQGAEESGEATSTFYKHIGIYGYRRDILLEIVKLSESYLEKAESLEQLRWIENGYHIQCALTTHDALSIDTPEDLQSLKSFRR
ncbi:MAG: 3-deoxy-manno-octulosonate cytidylyltransferase [Bacteroidetes bacterium]|nr:3-deoxy-manno-octulosonate cytidylyltransferase [Bacteroidota bacterium]